MGLGSVVIAHVLTTEKLTGYNWFFCTCAVSRGRNLKNRCQTRSGHGIHTPAGKLEVTFLVIKMTALEIQSIVASCKYSNWQWIIKHKTLKNWITRSL